MSEAQNPQQKQNMAQNIDKTDNLKNEKVASVWEIVKFIVIAAVIVIPLRMYVAEPYIVQGASMDPTFVTGQYLIVDRLGYRFEEPKRGDVVVFKYPKDEKTYFIKRIIGLPGETININKGIVTVSQKISDPAHGGGGVAQVLSEPYVSSLHEKADFFETTLLQDQYFVMGDNRAESSDSRYWGPLPKRLIIGRPMLRLFPVNKIDTFPGRVDESKNINISSVEANTNINTNK